MAQKPKTPNSYLSSVLEDSFIIEEYRTLKSEILERLNRVAKLEHILLTSSLVYVSTIFIPNRLFANPVTEPGTHTQNLDSLLIIYGILVAILPIIGIAIEIMIRSEADAIKRAGIYIKDNIERKVRTSGYRGWEDWLGKLDKSSRRRTSEFMAKFSRYSLITVYSFASAILLGFLVFRVWDWTESESTSLAAIIFLGYFAAGIGTHVFINRRSNQELSSTFYDYVVIDIDGCLANDDREVTKRNIDAVKAVQKMGIPVILATGRSKYGASYFMKKLDLKGWHAVSNGAKIINLSGNQEITQEIDIAVMSSGQIHDLTHELNALKVKWAAFGKEKIFCNKEHSEEIRSSLVARKDFLEDEIEVKAIEDNSAWIWRDDHEISKVWCMIDITESSKTHDVEKIDVSDLKQSRTTNDTVEFFRVEANKKKAIEEILKINDRTFANANVLALGDQDNDYELMDAAEHAIAPSNASQRIRKMGNVDASFDEDNNQDFVAEALLSSFNNIRI